jgi:hypothetical protein
MYLQDCLVQLLQCQKDLEHRIKVTEEEALVLAGVVDRARGGVTVTSEELELCGIMNHPDATENDECMSI